MNIYVDINSPKNSMPYLTAFPYTSNVIDQRVNSQVLHKVLQVFCVASYSHNSITL